MSAPSQPAPRDRATAPARDAATFLAWTAAALPRALPGPPLAPAALHAAWALAQRDVAARLALALARERLLAAELGDDGLVLRPGGRPPLVLPLRRRGAFGLHRPDLDAARDPALADPRALLAALALDLSLAPGVYARLADELADSAFHLAVARTVAELRARARLAGRPWPAPLDPENLVIAGHPWHPMCKTRGGLHLREVLRFAPEACAAAEVHAVDLAAPLAFATPGFSDMSRELFAPAPAGWLRVPVHALQRRRLPRLLAGLWGEPLRPAPVAPLPARALLSLRTVALAGLHLKLAADLHTTSARRQVSPMSARNGPEIGALLERIAAADPQARRGLRLQAEPAAAGLAADDPDHAALAGQLGVIVRRDLAAPARALADESDVPAAPAVWVCAALGERWPGDPDELHAAPDRAARPVPRDLSDRACSPVPHDLSDRSATSVSHDLSDGPGPPNPHGPPAGAALAREPLLLHRREGATLLRAIAAAYPTPLAALQRYVDLLVPPALRLCAAHGVALELHLQNTLVVHHRGRLCGFIARDLGGVRLHRGRLLAAGHAPTLAPGSFVLTADLAEVQSKLAHTLLHAHLGAVFGWAADDLGVDEAALWGHTRAVMVAALTAWATAEPRLAGACAEDLTALLAPVVRAKALLRMRIDERVSDYAYTEVDNALAAPLPPGYARPP